MVFKYNTAISDMNIQQKPWDDWLRRKRDALRSKKEGNIDSHEGNMAILTMMVDQSRKAATNVKEDGRTLVLSCVDKDCTA